MVSSSHMDVFFRGTNTVVMAEQFANVFVENGNGFIFVVVKKQIIPWQGLLFFGP